MTEAVTSGSKERAAPSVWIGRVLSGVTVLFLLFASGLPKFTMPQVTEPIMQGLGWPAKFTLLIGVIEVAGALLYAIPRTALLGAVLLTGLLGGAIATNLRVESPLFSHTLFGVYLGLMLWGGLWLRDSSLRALFPFKTK